MGSPALNVPTTRAASTPAPVSSPATSAVTTSNVNLRATASKTGRVLRVIPKGAVVSRFSCAGTWCRVAYQGQAGYVAQDYMRTVKIDSLLAAPVQPPSSSVYYANCTAARAAGATPLYSGDPGYRSKLDRDGDGIACE